MLAVLHFNLSNASVAGLKVKKSKKKEKKKKRQTKPCLTDYLCALENTFYYFVQRPNTIHFSVKSSTYYNEGNFLAIHNLRRYSNPTIELAYQ